MKKVIRANDPAGQANVAVIDITPELIARIKEMASVAKENRLSFCGLVEFDAVFYNTNQVAEGVNTDNGIFDNLDPYGFRDTDLIRTDGESMLVYPSGGVMWIGYHKYADLPSRIETEPISIETLNERYCKDRFREERTVKKDWGRSPIDLAEYRGHDYGEDEEP